MKGTIIKCLEELVVTDFGKDKWEKSLEDAGLDKSATFLPIIDVDDS
jgi:O-methyltransferase involved in polyketide biosynthesis